MARSMNESSILGNSINRALREGALVIFGALALGRRDIPAVPAVGVIWQPGPGFRLDLTLLYLSSPRHYLGLFAPYLERLWWRSETPIVSRVPRTMW